jgi:hypothetical protein
MIILYIGTLQNNDHYSHFPRTYSHFGSHNKTLDDLTPPINMMACGSLKILLSNIQETIQTIV